MRQQIVVAVLLDEFISTVAREKSVIEEENLQKQRDAEEALNPTVTVSIVPLSSPPLLHDSVPVRVG